MVSIQMSEPLNLLDLFTTLRQALFNFGVNNAFRNPQHSFFKPAAFNTGSSYMAFFSHILAAFSTVM